MPRTFEFPEPPCDFALPYPPDRMYWCMQVIGWPPRELARRMEMDDSSLRRMLKGEKHIPDPLAYWLETLAQIVMQLRKPVGWRAKPTSPTSGEEHDVQLHDVA